MLSVNEVSVTWRKKTTRIQITSIPPQQSDTSDVWNGGPFGFRKRLVCYQLIEADQLFNVQYPL